MHRVATFAVVLAAVVTALPSGSALAAKGGAGTETTTEHEHETVVLSKTVTNPCTGQEGTLLGVAKNSVFHMTTQPGGQSWATGTAQGTATFTPTEPGPVFSGHFVLWGGDSNNEKNAVEHSTGTIILRGPEGASVTIHMSSHMSTNAAGEPTVEFETMRLTARCE